MKFACGLILVAALAAVAQSAATGRIVGGSNAPAGSATYHAHLLIRVNAQATATHVGSGTLISTTHVLTSASNTRNFGWWNVGLGHLNRDNLQWHESVRAEINPNFDFNTLNNNLAIIFLTQPAVVSATIAPVNLPTLAQSPNPLHNEIGRISGFGHTQSTGVFANDLQVSFQRVIENQECITAWPHMAGFIQSVFCAEAAQGQICAGDQGAGFVVDNFFQPVLFGVVSFGDQNCGQGHRAVFTRVNPYRDWIQQQTQIQWPN